MESPGLVLPTGSRKRKQEEDSSPSKRDESRPYRGAQSLTPLTLTFEEVRESSLLLS